LNAELEAKTASLIKEAEDVLVQLLLQFQITCMLLLDFMHQEFHFILARPRAVALQANYHGQL
jgi:hypothetical protein